MMTCTAYVDQLLNALHTQVATLVATVIAGDLAGAKSAWLTAHLTWLKIGQDDGAYGAFGELGPAIDGTAAGLVLGIADPHFTGGRAGQSRLPTDRPGGEELQQVGHWREGLEHGPDPGEAHLRDGGGGEQVGQLPRRRPRGAGRRRQRAADALPPGWP
jgi:hypothetical protein